MVDLADEHLGICLNLRKQAITQWVDLGFNALCCGPGGKLLGCSEDGIFELTGSSDAGKSVAADRLIASDFSFMIDFGRTIGIQKVYVSGEFSGGFYVDITMSSNARMEDDAITESYTIVPEHVTQKQYSAEFTASRDNGIGRYALFRFRNKDGGDFSLDSMAVTPIRYSKR